jgi:hypothetical protein
MYALAIRLKIQQHTQLYPVRCLDVFACQEPEHRIEVKDSKKV